MRQKYRHCVRNIEDAVPKYEDVASVGHVAPKRFKDAARKFEVVAGINDVVTPEHEDAA